MSEADVAAEVPVVIPLAKSAPKKPRPGFWEACLFTVGFWLVLAAAFCAVAIPVLTYVVISNEGNQLNSETILQIPLVRAAIAWAMPASYLAALIFALVVIRLVVGRTWFHDLGLARIPPYHLLLALLAIPGFMILSNALGMLVKPVDRAILGPIGLGNLGDAGEKTNQSIVQIFGGFPAWFAVFAIGLGPGIVEELWCRGYLGRGLIARNGWLRGVALTSVFFGFLHLFPPSYVFLTAVMGACLHFVYIASRSLWIPMLMHLLNNGISALDLIKALPSDRLEAAVNARGVPILLAAIGLFGVSAFAMWRARWTWSGETPGILVPPIGSEASWVKRSPHVPATIAAAALCAALLALLLA